VISGQRVINGLVDPAAEGRSTMVSAERLRLVLFYEYFHGDNGAGISAEGLRICGRGAIKSAAAGRQMGAAR
jgi:hypothetical protein